MGGGKKRERTLWGEKQMRQCRKKERKQAEIETEIGGVLREARRRRAHGELERDGSWI